MKPEELDRIDRCVMAVASEEDARHVIATDVPALVAEVRRLREELERAGRAKGDKWWDGYVTGCEASHSIGCDAVQGERDDLRSEVVQLRQEVRLSRSEVRGMRAYLEGEVP